MMRERSFISFRIDKVGTLQNLYFFFVVSFYSPGCNQIYLTEANQT